MESEHDAMAAHPHRDIYFLKKRKQGKLSLFFYSKLEVRNLLLLLLLLNVRLLSPTPIFVSRKHHIALIFLLEQVAPLEIFILLLPPRHLVKEGRETTLSLRAVSVGGGAEQRTKKLSHLPQHSCRWFFVVISFHFLIYKGDDWLA